MQMNVCDRSSKTFRVGGKLYRCDQPLVMGIVNLTPDSFFSGSRAQICYEIERQVDIHISQGADILDFGAYSTRPGSGEVSEEEEMARFSEALPVIRSIKDSLPVSVDTFRSTIVRRVYDSVGDVMVNDISAGHLDQAMYTTVADLHLTYIGMHMRGTPQTMQNDTHYASIIDECIKYFAKLTDKLRLLGIADIIIDPGFGFSKTLEQNYELLAQLDQLSVLQRPVLVGISRKSMIYKLLSCSPDEALNGTTVAHAIGLLKGADILRVHDVLEAKETVRIIQQMRSCGAQRETS